MPLPNAPLPADVLAALQRGSSIEAIKLLRESTGLGLKEAKDAIDQHLRGHPMPAATGAAPRSLPPEVAAAMQRGNKIEAIRLLREKTGLGLKDAKDAVESLHQETQTGANHLSPGEVARSRMGIWLAAAMAAAVVFAYYFFGRPG